MRIALIGGGAMGEAIIKGVLDKELNSPAEIVVSDITRDRLDALSQRYGVTCSSDNREPLKGAEVVILAVKPQSLTGLMGELKEHLHPRQLVLSIIAGASISTLANGLNHETLVRVMPNTPAQIGEGMSVWTATENVNDDQREEVRSILRALGTEIYVADEKYLDMATAVSGSGPAYIFLIMESFIEAAVGIGLPRETAEELVIQTMLGATHLAQRAGENLAELRRKVTSPGGTTAAGLLQLEEEKLNQE